MSSDIKHWRLNAKVYDDRVEEIHLISDPTKNIRRKEHTRVWQVERLLGRGSFGEVRLEKNKDDGQVRAVKRIAMINEASNSECEKEMKALLEFSKQKYKEAAVFVEFFGWFRQGNNMYLAMEFVHLGDLEKNVVAQSGRLPENECRDIAEQILSGLEIMHAESFAHRDLKPQNVLVISGPPQWWVKLADFGLSKQLTDSTLYNTRAGTQSYMAPEILELLESYDSGLTYTNAVDIWSVGCIVYRLVTGVVPFPNGRFLVNYCNDKSLFPLDALFDSDIKSMGAKFIRQLLVPLPNNRPSASQALQNSWILSGSDNLTTSPELSYCPVSKAKSGVPQQTLFNIDYNTASHPGLQSHQPLPSKSWDTVLSSSPSLESSPSSSKPTVRPCLKSAAHLSAQNLDSQNLPKEQESKQVISSKELAVTNSDPKIFARPELGSSKSIDKPPGLLAVDEISKVKSSVHSDEISTSILKKMPLRCYKILEGHKDEVFSVAFSPNGKFVASVSADKTIRLWDISTGETQSTIVNQNATAYCVTFSPDGKLMATSCGLHAHIRDVPTGELRLSIGGHYSIVNDIAFSPDGGLVASASFDGTIRLWDLVTGALRCIIKGRYTIVYSVAFSPDGKLAASASSDGTVQLWDVVTGAVKYTLKGHTGHVVSVAYSPDGKLVASASWDNTVRLWDAVTGAVQYKMEGHTRSVNSVAFSPDGRVLASASRDETIRLWETATGAVCCVLKDHTNSVEGVAFSPDGRLLASASCDNTVRLWGKV